MKRAALFIILLISVLSSGTLEKVHAQANTFKRKTAQEWVDAALNGTDNNSSTTNSVWTDDSFYKVGNVTAGIPGTAADFRRSAVGFLSNTVALTFATPPADLGVWIADTGQSLGFITKQAHAQGIGFSGLLPLLPVWKVFRNVAYLLMAAVMVVIGFLIMFRKKIDPKTVVTAQNAIPRVIISLILITFSYAIVGFVIDIMYLAMALVGALFQSTGLLTSAQENMTSAHLFSTFWVSLTSFSPLKLLFGNQTTPATQFWGSAAIAAAIAAIGGFNPITNIIGLVVGGLIPLLYAIYGIALLFLWIKLLAFFVSAYIQIILALLIAPFQLLAESFPGSTAFSSWFKNLIANVAVFPVAAAMFMLSSIFLQFSNTNQGTIWVPPYVGLSTSAVAVAALVSIGLLFAIQPVCASIKEALKARPIIGGGGGGGAGGSAMQWLSAAYYIKSIDPAGVISKLTGQKPGEQHH
jgi:hypothetical protein